MTTDTTLTLYSFHTPNGRRIAVLLETLGIKYNYKQIDINKEEQFTKSFSEISPYCKIPAITDIDENSGKEISIFETGSIIQFIVNKYDKKHIIHYSLDDPLYWEQNKWFFFTTSTLSPVQGELSFFLNFASEKDEFAISRAQKNVHRVYKTIESRLVENKGWFVGEKVNIVDVSAFTFVNRHEFVQLDIENEYPNTWAWLLKVREIDGFERGYNLT